MSRYTMVSRSVLTLLIVLTVVSASQAGWFGRGRANYDSYYYYPTCPAATVYYTPQQSNIPAASQATVSTTGPTVYTAAKPVIGEPAAVPQAVSVPQSGYYAPAASGYSGSGGYSTTARSSWDFGSFPPYNH